MKRISFISLPSTKPSAEISSHLPTLPESEKFAWRSRKNQKESMTWLSEQELLPSCRMEVCSIQGEEASCLWWIGWSSSSNTTQESMPSHSLLGMRQTLNNSSTTFQQVTVQSCISISASFQWFLTTYLLLNNNKLHNISKQNWLIYRRLQSF